MNIEEKLQIVREILIDYPKNKVIAQEELTKVELELQDLNHIIELGSLNAAERSLIINQMMDALKKRRTLKDELDMLTIVDDLTKSNISHGDINTAIGRVRKLERRWDKRIYTLRVRRDLQKYLDRGSKQ